MKGIFVTGIGTDVGKTVISALLVKHFNADYWKPVQAGVEPTTDAKTIKELVPEALIHPERYLLQEPMSPHAAADREGVEINIKDFELPETENTIVVEGAGGLMVPINYKGDTYLDLIQHLNIPVVVVSRNYLGSINHTLMTLALLQQTNTEILGVVLNDKPNPETEKIILDKTGLKCLGNIEFLEEVNEKSIELYSKKIKNVRK